MAANTPHPSELKPLGGRAGQLLRQMNEKLKEIDAEIEKVDEKINKAEKKARQTG